MIIIMKKYKITSLMTTRIMNNVSKLFHEQKWGAINEKIHRLQAFHWILLTLNKCYVQT